MNAALRKALAAAQLTETDVAAHLGVDPKTVRRWLSGQRPYPRHRWALADLLQVQEERLWLQGSQSTAKRNSTSQHTHHLYPHRWEVPREAWHDLFSEAEQEIGILVYSGLFLADDAGMLKLLEARAKEGVSIRILLGDPTSNTLMRRGNEERIGTVLAARASNALLLFHGLFGTDGVEIRMHSTILYNSIYLTEKRIFANHHVYGLPAAMSPTVEIDRDDFSSMAKTYVQSFELVWKQGYRCE